ncbi:MAG TPA: glycosyl hydrolase [Candidatus Paceibacterota bacterium]|nr:glycosyl hydrolase [Candidatus Paceibacterota bacterium]
MKYLSSISGGAVALMGSIVFAIGIIAVLLAPGYPLSGVSLTAALGCISFSSNACDTLPPSIPAPRISGKSVSSVSVAWDASTDNIAVAGYDVYVNGKITATISDTSYTFVGLKCSSVYTFGVDAYDTSGNHSKIGKVPGSIQCVGQGVLLGVRADQDDAASIKDATTSENDILEVEQAIGRKVAIDNQYANWADFPPNLDQAAWDIANGRTPMISWKTSYPGHAPGCATAADIVNGVYDDQLHGQAAAIKALGGLVLIRWHYEMEHPQGGKCFYDVDVNKDPVTAGKEYVAAWQHVYDLFKADAVTNVQWVWAPGNDAFSDNQGDGGPTDLWKDFYPGNDYVDWIGSDTYNKISTSSVAINESNRFLNFYNDVASLGKPLMLSETGAVGPDPQMFDNGIGCDYSIGGTDPDPATEWITSATATFKSQFPMMRAFVYWSNVGDGGPQKCNNYILRGASLDAFTAMGHTPYFEAFIQEGANGVPASTSAK